MAIRSKTTFAQVKVPQSNHITVAIIAACALACVSTAVYAGHKRSVQLHAVDPKVSHPRETTSDGLLIWSGGNSTPSRAL